ncbi:Crp/Fnr family transcriptional regulator [Myroides odoratus]|uniref:Crp/Fnr family transcriptional regulator n=1 Tax=Myroides odoratus TaxID=256 RepID=UPI0039B055A5
MDHPLLLLLSQKVNLSESEKKLGKDYFEPVEYSKNQRIEEEGKIPQYLYFVVSGFVRLYHYNDKGEQLTTHINCPPGFITSYSNFSNQTPSEENLECITDCKLLRITKANLDFLIGQSVSFKDFSISVFQEALTYNEKRARELATLSAEMRYLKLLEEYPELVHHVPMQYIASYLGMNPKSLSRIRKQIIR